ncbi:alpha/beta hydrolase [Rodentibacter trehalosifermentans]|uniref:Xaa-Pro dipeptidyl-peptidase-like domain-containing protein n=1 Tax=Rodentibacter trehalosifermentans TaxID=1908263 RepID=A0A1V3IWB9_9PAST|nr:alpha/beta hydrolase [Rodentibacter trehalosifermentans]OOF46568.1 hypothetical protein BKK51_02125 [Rodentibacter trehalosifermentans]OOF48344.1 hypothetical protein BKK52_06270 [Rodentibacter trehalosifermentans]OOF52800.1 hypothetical protein BKK53_03605 [Rodentibacter trehalosifermentans]
MKKTFFKKTALIVTLGSALLGGNAMATLPQNATAIEIPAQQIQLTQEWDKVFPKSDKVEHRKVTFKNRYGITLVGDLYVPKDAKGKLPAIAVSGPFGAVKEQSSGLYAQHLAERGFVTLAFDGSYTGESAGLPRNMASPEINTEDFSAAVDFLGLQDFVNPDEIGILGICGWGGFALNAAIVDTRVKAVAVSTMYDMTRIMANGYEIKLDPKGQYDRVPGLDAKGRDKMKQSLNAQRWVDTKNGTFALTPKDNHLPPQEKLTDDTPLFVKEYSNYYKTERGYHPRSINSTSGWTQTAPLAFINMPILQRAAELKTPALVVHGEKAHSRYFGEEVFKSLGSKNKELYIVPNANHTDLYDDVANKIPYDKFEAFFKANLK